MRSAAKLLRFPLGGLAKNGSYRDTTYPTEDSVYSTPMALNVIGECAFSDRMRGGSRPGLKKITGVTAANTGKWLWPNGEAILWPNRDNMVFADLASVVLPDGSRLILQHAPQAIYRNRYVKCDGTTWMASRTDDFGNFDFGGEADDVTKAVAGNIADAGQKGEAITAVANFGDQRLFIATRRRLAVISGEPTGAVTTLSANVGIISADAWCNADGVLYFMGPNGLYAVSDGAPMLVSHQLPEDLKGLQSAILIYDPHYRGIHIFTTVSASVTRDYFYDIDNKAFWPVSYPATMRPTAGAFGVIDNVNRIIFRCADGQYRYWADDQTTDDGTAIQSQVAIGPFKCGVAEGDGMLDEIDVTLANGSASVTVGIISAHTAEDAASGADELARQYSCSSGFNASIRPRKRGGWAKLTLSATGRWAYESIYARIKALGRLRP